MKVMGILITIILTLQLINCEDSVDKDAEIILNGSFEQIDPANNIPAEWSVWNDANFISLDTTEAQDGTHSMRADISEQVPVHHTLYQIIDPGLFSKGSRYKLSYWIKSTQLTSEQQSYWTNLQSENSEWGLQIGQVHGPYPAREWEIVEYDFTYPEDLSTSNIYLHFYFSTSAEFNVWIDNVSIKAR